MSPVLTPLIVTLFLLVPTDGHTLNGTVTTGRIYDAREGSPDYGVATHLAFTTENVVLSSGKITGADIQCVTASGGEEGEPYRWRCTGTYDPSPGIVIDSVGIRGIWCNRNNDASTCVLHLIGYRNQTTGDALGGLLLIVVLALTVFMFVVGALTKGGALH